MGTIRIIHDLSFCVQEDSKLIVIKTNVCTILQQRENNDNHCCRIMFYQKQFYVKKRKATSIFMAIAPWWQTFSPLFKSLTFQTSKFQTKIEHFLFRICCLVQEVSCHLPIFAGFQDAFWYR